MFGLVLKWVISNLRTILLGAMIAFVMALYPAGYVKGIQHEQGLWAAADAAAVKRGEDARAAAETAIPTVVDTPPVVDTTKVPPPPGGKAPPAGKSGIKSRSVPTHKPLDRYDRG